MSEHINTRLLVLELLLETEREGTYSHLALRSLLEKYRYLPVQERKFMTRLFEGTMERRIELDYIIDQFSKTKTKKMKPAIRFILEMGVYQLKYMDGVPNSAACNEAVKLAVKKGFGALKGFVNGVLRNIGRNLDQIIYPDAKSDPVHYMQVRYSMPEWIVSMWEKQFGWEQTEQMLQAFLSENATTIRINLNQISPEELDRELTDAGIRTEPAGDLPYARKISGYDTLTDIPAFKKGLFYIQDISSMMAAECAGVKTGDVIIDVCAAPGGKSIHLAEKLQGTGHVTARDLTDYKVSLIQENINRIGVQNMTAEKWDARVPDKAFVKKADVVIADLPCSGLGVIGKKTDIKYRVTPESVQELAALQKEILDVVQSYVKPGGKLVYSTCTVTEAENQENTRWFLEKHSEFELLSEQQILPKAGMQDGFYIAVFQLQSRSLCPNHE